MAVSSAQRTSCSTCTTSSLPFITPPGKAQLSPGSYLQNIPRRWRGSVRLQVGAEVRKAGRARPPAARAGADLLEGEPFLAVEPGDGGKGHLRALAAGHGPAPG